MTVWSGLSMGCYFMKLLRALQSHSPSSSVVLLRTASTWVGLLSVVAFFHLNLSEGVATQGNFNLYNAIRMEYSYIYEYQLHNLLNNNFRIFCESPINCSRVNKHTSM